MFLSNKKQPKLLFVQTFAFVPQAPSRHSSSIAILNESKQISK